MILKNVRYSTISYNTAFGIVFRVQNRVHGLPNIKSCTLEIIKP